MRKVKSAETAIYYESLKLLHWLYDIFELSDAGAAEPPGGKPARAADP